MPRVVSVNVGQPRQISMRRGRPLMSSIVKDPVEGRVLATGVNLEGDRQADLTVHGGADKAVYAYASEDIAWWAEALDRPEVAASWFGENLTTEGLDVTGTVVGERWRIGEAEFEVSQPRLPCSKLGIRFGDGRMVKAFARASRPGAYLRIIGEGTVGAGDEVELLHRPEHGVTVELVSRAFLLDPSLQPQAAKAPELAASLADELRAVA
jgi:MOSC domain-containing protein YiiM